MKLFKDILGLVHILIFVTLLPLSRALGLFEALNNNGATEFAALLQANPELLDAAISGQIGTIFAPLDSSSSSGYPSREALNTTEQQALAYQISSYTQKWGNLTQPTLEGVIATLLDGGNILNNKTQSTVFRLNSQYPTPSNTSTSRGLGGENYGEPQPQPQSIPIYAEIASGLGDTVNIINPYIYFTKCGLLEYGYIHIVDNYFTLPQSLSDSVAQIPELSTFSSLLNSNYGLKSLLDNQPSITLFIPNNTALEAAGITPETANLTDIVEGWVIPEFVGYTPDLTEPLGGIGFQTTMNGSVLFISATNIEFGPLKGQKQEIYINAAKITKRNIILQNGVAHIVDSLL